MLYRAGLAFTTVGVATALQPTSTPAAKGGSKGTIAPAAKPAPAASGKGGGKGGATAAPVPQPAVVSTPAPATAEDGEVFTRKTTIRVKLPNGETAIGVELSGFAWSSQKVFGFKDMDVVGPVVKGGKHYIVDHGNILHDEDDDEDGTHDGYCNNEWPRLQILTRDGVEPDRVETGAPATEENKDDGVLDQIADGAAEVAADVTAAAGQAGSAVANTAEAGLRSVTNAVGDTWEAGRNLLGRMDDYESFEKFEPYADQILPIKDFDVMVYYRDLPNMKGKTKISHISLTEKTGAGDTMPLSSDDVFENMQKIAGGATSMMIVKVDINELDAEKVQLVAGQTIAHGAGQLVDETVDGCSTCCKGTKSALCGAPAEAPAAAPAAEGF